MTHHLTCGDNFYIIYFTGWIMDTRDYVYIKKEYQTSRLAKMTITFGILKKIDNN